MLKVDFHTHSVASLDGSTTKEEYIKILETGLLDCIAITDHNSIYFAQELQKELGHEKIIVGEEINTNQGEIIGLFLTSIIKPNLEIEETIEKIKSQGGLVYIPHPFETVRKGVNKEVLDKIKDGVDLIEGANGRAFFENYGPQAQTWARLNNKFTLASSDAHRMQALGKTYTELADIPTAENLISLAEKARKVYHRPNLLDILAPKLNRILKKTNYVK